MNAAANRYQLGRNTSAAQILRNTGHIVIADIFRSADQHNRHMLQIADIIAVNILRRQRPAGSDRPKLSGIMGS